MLNYGVMKLGGVKLLATVLSPGISLLIVGTAIGWKLNKNEKQLTKENKRLSSQIKQLHEDILDLKEPVTDQNTENTVVTEKRTRPINKNNQSSTTDSLKQTFFKQILEDNLEIRTL